MAEARVLVPFRMPSLGADMEEGTLVEWSVAEGDTVHAGDIFAVVETVKGAVEIEIFDDGVVRRLLATVGETLPVGAPLAEVEVSPDAAAKAAAEPAATPAPRLAGPSPAPGAATGAGQPASPAARQLAREKGIDLATVTGTGPDGAIVRGDVEAAAAREAPARPPKGGVDLAAMRQAIGASMARSKREIPHYYLQHHADLSAAETFLAARNADAPPDRRLLMGALFVKAVAKAAGRVDRMNGHFLDGAFRPAGKIHVGVAVALRGGGLTAPAIHDVDTLDLSDLMARMRDLVARARVGRLRASEMRDATITLSSLGDRGVEAMTAVIVPPQVAIVAFGTPMTRPWVVGGEVVPRSVVAVTLAADHRVSDARQGARFLAAVTDLVERPEEL